MQDEIQWNQIIEVPTSSLISFTEHPFRVVTDYQMLKLTESIKGCGILTSLIVRKVEDGKYEIISGHRRKHVAEQLGVEKVQVIIRTVM